MCSLSFFSRSQLGSHKSKHLKKFVCNIEGCEKRFENKVRLRDHLKIHSGVRDSQCHLCEKSYFLFKDLKIHLDVVHGRKTFFCEFCEYTNSRKDYLGNHLKSAHKLGREKMKESLGRSKCVVKEV